MHPFLTFGRLSLPVYGLLAVFAAVFCVILLACTSLRRGIPREDIIYGAFYGIIGAIIGAKGLYLLTLFPGIFRHWQAVAAAPSVLLTAFSGGFVFYGGLIGGILGIRRYCRRYHLEFLSMTDTFGVVLPLGHSIGRIGCFFAGCCYGLPYEGPLAVVFPAGSYGMSGVSLFPLQLTEAFLDLLLFLFLLMLSRSHRPSGFLSGCYLCGYTVFRFVLEFFRGDGLRGILWGFSTSQWLSVFLLFIGIFLLFRSASPKYRL